MTGRRGWHVLMVLLAVTLAGCASAGNTASNGPSPSTPEASPSAASAASPTATSGGVEDCPQHQHYNPGTYRIGAAVSQTVPLTVTMTSSWVGCNPAYKDTASGSTLMLGFWDVRTVLRDPCHWQASLLEPATGPSVDDLVSAIAEQDRTIAEPPVRVTLDGRMATYVRLSGAPDADPGDCDGGPDETNFRLWNGATDASSWALFADLAPGLTGEVWALDIEGLRVVVQTAWFQGASDGDLAELHGIVDSIHFLP